MVFPRERKRSISGVGLNDSKVVPTSEIVFGCFALLRFAQILIRAFEVVGVECNLRLVRVGECVVNVFIGEYKRQTFRLSIYFVVSKFYNRQTDEMIVQKCIVFDYV